MRHSALTLMLLFALPVLLWSGRAHAVNAYLQEFDVVSVTEAFLESCYAEGGDAKEFAEWADSNYFRVTHGDAEEFLAVLGISSKGVLWSPTQTPKEVFVTMSKEGICYMIGSVPNPEMLHYIIPDVVEENKYKNVDKWERDGDVLVHVERDPSVSGRRFQTDIHVEIEESFADDYISIITYKNRLLYNFTISYSRKSLKLKEKFKEDAREEAREMQKKIEEKREKKRLQQQEEQTE